MHMTGLGWGDRRSAHDRQVPAGDDGAARRRDGTLEDMVGYLADKPLEFHSGHAVALRPVDRPVRPPRGDSCRVNRSTSTCNRRSLSRLAWPTPASRAAKPTRPARGQLHPRRRQIAAPDGRPGNAARTGTSRRSCPAAAARRHDRGLPAVHADAAQRRRTRRRPHPRAQDRRADVASTTFRAARELAEFAAPGGYGETGFDGVGFGLTMAVGLGQAATQTDRFGGRLLLGWRGVDDLLDRPGRGSHRRLHDPAHAVRHASTSAGS